MTTYGLGLSVFGLALSLRSGRAAAATATLGRLSLGIYSVHLLLLFFIMPQVDATLLVPALTKAALTLLAATVLSAVIALLPGVWRLASYRRLKAAPSRPRPRASGAGPRG